MSEHSFKVGPITWSIRNEPGVLGYAGGLMKGEVQKSTITGWGVADLTGKTSGVVTEDQAFVGGLAGLSGTGAMGQLLVAYEPVPGKKKLASVNLDLGNVECAQAITALKVELGAKFVGLGPIGTVRKALGASNVGPAMAAVLVLALIVAGIAFLALRS